MIQFNVISGKMAGCSWAVRHFPVRIGRAADSDFRIEDEGVWDEHLVLSLDQEKFLLTVQPSALARVNGEPVATAYLRNGDSLEIGGVSLRFWLSPVRQKGLQLRETLVWAAVAIVGLAQIAILYRLLQ